MEEQLISYETAKLAKEKGFDEKVYREYDKSGYLRCTSKSADVVLGPYDELLKSTEYPAPTQTLLQKWLREVHNIEVLISRIPPEAVLADKNKGKNILKNYNCYIWNLNSNPRIANNGTFLDIYEEALEIGLQEALKLIK